jgi:hypothetical protein
MNQDIMSANTDKVPVPFKGNWEGLTYTTGIYTRLIECQGNCTHLGLFTATVEYVLTYNDPNFPPDPFLGGGLASGSAEMIAANGDKLYLGNFVGIWDAELGQNPMVSFTFTADVIGGTGRFDGATGSLEGSGTQNLYENPLQPQEIWFSWTGLIMY